MDLPFLHESLFIYLTENLQSVDFIVWKED